MLATPLPKILVVDDDSSVRDFLRQALKPIASRVGEAGDAPTALEAIERGDYDIILCDIWMPGASGLDFLQMAQQSQWDVAFILITGQVHLKCIIEGLRLRASDFLIKPFALQELTEAVARSYQHLLVERQARAYREALEASVQRRTRDLEAALKEVEQNYEITL
jgi:two-component system, NtrC family, response regulator AtoC